MREKISGIYRIVCVKNGRYYFGSSSDIQARWQRHKQELRKNVHVNQVMQRCYNKHAESSFRFELVELIPKEMLWETETKYLTEHVGKSNCMNMVEVANGFGKWTAERRRAKSVAMKAHMTKYWATHSEMRKTISDKLKGTVPWNVGLTKESDERIRQLETKRWTSARRKAHSRNMKTKNPLPNVAWNKGLTKDTNEILARIGKRVSGAKKGKPLSAKHRAAMKGRTPWNKGKKTKK
jgi:group I intron endonuclease